MWISIEDIFSIQVSSEEELKSQGLIEIIGEEIDIAYIKLLKH